MLLAHVLLFENHVFNGILNPQTKWFNIILSKFEVWGLLHND
jgi:hypothetical protein